MHMSAFGGKADIEAGPYLLSATAKAARPRFQKMGLKLAAVASVAAGTFRWYHAHGRPMNSSRISMGLSR